MLEELLIFTRGGLILWTCKELGNALKGSPIDTLIRSCLLEERSADASYDYDAPSAGAAYTLKWTFHNELNLVFVAVYQRILRLLYVDDLLAAVKREFAAVYDPRKVAYDDFDGIFRQLQKEAEARAEEMRKLKQVTARGPANATVKKQGQLAGHKVSQRSSSDSGSGKDDADRNLVKANGMANGNHRESMNGIKGSRAAGGMVKSEDVSSDGGAFDVNKLQKLRSKGGKKTSTVVGKVSKAEPKKATKKNRVWDDSPSESQLDFTDPADQREEGEGEVVAAVQGESMMDKEEELSSDSDDDVDEVRENAQPSSKKKGWFTSVLQRYVSSLLLCKLNFLTISHALVAAYLIELYTQPSNGSGRPNHVMDPVGLPCSVSMCFLMQLLMTGSFVNLFLWLVFMEIPGVCFGNEVLDEDEVLGSYGLEPKLKKGLPFSRWGRHCHLVCPFQCLLWGPT